MKLYNFILLIIFVCSASLLARVTAFPGAEGAGKYTMGGRGGDVYIVTNLNDDGPGSLREAVEATGPRTVVFEVSGTIALESDLKVKNPYLTIAGQTAPGEGICLKDYTFFVGQNEVIIRFMRFRLGDESGVEKDAIWGRYCRSVIIDHCSASWSVDEAMSLYGIDSLTIQWCLVSESLYNSTHSKGAHGYGGIWGGRVASFHHNLLAHHSSRNPRFAGGGTTPTQNVDFRNNVIYNWGFNSTYGGEDGTINMVANYYKPGPATKSSVSFRICEPYDQDGRWYIEDNVMIGSEQVTEDNWNLGVQGGNAVASVIRSTEPFPNIDIPEQTAEEAYQLVLQDVGANLPVRDEIDARILMEVENGTTTFEGPGYETIQRLSDTTPIRGIIDSQTDVGGWPELASATPPEDADRDGMADDWERDNGLSPEDATDRNLVNADGYTMLEVYLNSLVSGTNTRVAQSPDAPQTFSLAGNYPNPFNPRTTIAFTVQGHGRVTLQIYDIRGRLVRDLFKGSLASGRYEKVWDGRDDYGLQVSSGVYFGRLQSGDQSRVIKMQLIR